MQLIAYIPSRPGAAIENYCYKGMDQVFKYKGDMGYQGIAAMDHTRLRTDRYLPDRREL